MDPARSLHSVFTELTGERDYAEASGLGPDEVLAAGGHPDLPEGLVAEAVVNYADTAPFEVAEHLAPYVRANSAVPQSGTAATGDEPHWYSLLATAPPVGLGAGADVLDADAGAVGPGPAGDVGGFASPEPDPAHHFGHGHHAAADEPSGPPETPAESAPVWPSTGEQSHYQGLAGYEPGPGPEALRTPEEPDAPTGDDLDDLDDLDGA
jgi:hypothetical protein